ncbi:MAG: hypothetical protein ACI4QI_00185 [Candidatus Coproplasma sp.]
MKKRLIAILLSFCALLGAAFAFAGCKNEKTRIEMYLWDKSMTKTLTPWLEEQFPEYEFNFVVGYNSMDYYTDLAQRGGDMPDIITCRRFSINDAAHLSDRLMNLNNTEIVGTFYSSYIGNNRETDGGIRWLPMCAEVDGYIANLDLFEDNGIKVPENYAEFKVALAAFEEKGIRGFAGDWGNDYACLELLQGNSIPLLMSREGKSWRMKYESETDENPVGLDEAVWPQVFERFESYLNDVSYKKEDYGNSSQSYAFLSGQLAIMRGTATDCAAANAEGMNCVMLPYFGETESENWVLTYPMCQLAVAKHVGEDAVRKKAVIRVLNKIFSEEGQSKLSSGSSVLSYNKDIDLEMGKPFERISDCVESNRLYMRLASEEFFSISKSVVRKMLNGYVGYNGSTYGAVDAYADFNAQLTAEKQPAEEDVIITQANAYSLDFGKHGIEAASSVMNTMRRGSECEIAIGYSPIVSAPVFAGDYTKQQLTWLLTAKTAGYTAEYTGEEIISYMDWLINVKEDGSNPVRHFNMLPVTSGMEYSVKDNGGGEYTLLNVNVGGQPIEEDRVYKVFLLGDDGYITDAVYCNCPMPAQLKAKRTVLSGKNVDILLGCLNVTSQLLEAESYVTVTK